MNNIGSEFRMAIIDPVGSKAGLDVYDRRLAAALREAGIGAAVLSDTGDSSASLPPFFKFEETRNLFSVFRLYREFRRCVEWCEHHGIEAVLFHMFAFSRFDEWLLSRLRARGIRTFVIVHDVEPFVARISSRRRNRIVCELSDEILVHNDFAAEELRRVTGKSDGVTVIPHGHFIDELRPPADRQGARRRLGIPADAFCPLFFGMIKEVKGIDTFCEALEMAPEGVVGLVAGRPRGDHHAFMGKLQTLEKNRRLVLKAAYVSPEEMEDWMMAADCVVLPYKRSYQSGVAIQAMSRKVPVILSDIPSHRRWVGSAASALPVPPGDAAAWVRAILHLRDRPEAGLELAESAYRQLSSNHAWMIPAGIIRNLLHKQ
jgi:glycosyltransferase involved in cell wall biosynthesis